MKTSPINFTYLAPIKCLATFFLINLINPQYNPPKWIFHYHHFINEETETLVVNYSKLQLVVGTGRFIPGLTSKPCSFDCHNWHNGKKGDWKKNGTGAYVREQERKAILSPTCTPRPCPREFSFFTPDPPTTYQIISFSLQLLLQSSCSSSHYSSHNFQLQLQSILIPLQSLSTSHQSLSGLILPSSFILHPEPS